MAREEYVVIPDSCNKLHAIDEIRSNLPSHINQLCPPASFTTVTAKVCQHSKNHDIVALPPVRNQMHDRTVLRLICILPEISASPPAMGGVQAMRHANQQHVLAVSVKQRIARDAQRAHQANPFSL